MQENQNVMVDEEEQLIEQARIRREKLAKLQAFFGFDKKYRRSCV